ncbi:hypothetical protein B0A55_07004 [Friedmanniomyces simplex]|uniref:Glycoside hydrolase family 5 domain-containing protein n=1 Tax=Friedmanniomyces simplex TaxID=329884 RepID=A0A4U0X4R7_9PEZI|nr:hypothetical protein B0A55_07004 [Friedmanniomyces simplex]
MEQTAARDRAASTTSSTIASRHGHRRTASIKTAGKPLGSSVISLFLTNLRLLDFDLLPDWPGVTTTSLGHQDARARIRCTEFALFNLFKLYDPATTSDKLQPFYPPLEPLQSINLRAALYRCLNDLKKNGVLLKETVLRRTMLDECQGEKFWELCLGFSALVLRKVTMEKKHTYARHRIGPPVAERLSTAHSVSRSQMESLLPLAIAHKAALGKLLAEKREKRETFGRLYDVFATKETELVGRKVLVQELSRSRLPQARLDKLSAVEANVCKSWIGSEELRHALLGGQSTISDPVLTESLDRVAKASEAPAKDSGLLQALKQTASRQNHRVRRWQSMHEQISASKQADGWASIADAKAETQLCFDKHRSLTLRDARQLSTDQLRQRSDTHAIVSKYDEILTAMREELRNNRRATAPTRSPTKPVDVRQQRQQPPARKPSVHLDTLGDAPDSYQRSPSRSAVSMRPAVGRRVSSRSSSRSYHAPKVDGQRQPIPLKSEIFSPLKAKRRSCSSPLSSSSVLATPVEDSVPEAVLTARPTKDESRPASESSEANSAIDSGVGIDIHGPHSAEGREGSGKSEDSMGDVDAHVTASPDRAFKKPAPPAASTGGTPRPSLAERTRMSMAFRSVEDVHGLLPEFSMPTPSENPAEQAAVRNETAQQAERRTTLADRTRESISLAPLPPASKPALHTRTRSSIYPVNQFDTPRKSRPSSKVAEQYGEESSGRRDITPREQLFSPEAEYDSVFRPRPKVKLSPVSSPSPAAAAERGLLGEDRLPSITPSVYDSTSAADEWHLCNELGKAKCLSTLNGHWSSYYTRNDLEDIRNAGLNAVRIPLGYWAVDVQDYEPYVSGQYPYLIRAVQWASELGLSVLIDLHGAPGSQNGQDNSGLIGPVLFTSNTTNTDRSLIALRNLTAEFSQSMYNDTVIGIELLNEPRLNSGNFTMVDLQSFYTDGAGTIQNATTDNTLNVTIHDAFWGPQYWKDYNPLNTAASQPANGLSVDTHQYYAFEPLNNLSHAQIFDSVCNISQLLKQPSSGIPSTMVGEWSLETGAAPSAYSSSQDGSDDQARRTWFRLLAEAQMVAYAPNGPDQSSIGWFFWAWKTEYDIDTWSYRRGVSDGYIPSDASNTSTYAFPVLENGCVDTTGFMGAAWG